MSHNLEKSASGEYKFAYSDHQAPWHRLGVPMKGLQKAEVMLEVAQADYTVVLAQVAAVDSDGRVIYTQTEEGLDTPLLVEDSRATIRINKDGTFGALSTVGTRFVPSQNSDCLNRALDIVGAADMAVVDTCGVLNGGREFFASIDLGPLVIDPAGTRDSIERYLLVRNGHDGKTPITFANTSIRAVCKNTVMAGLGAASRVFTARHTRNQDSAIDEAKKVLEFSTAWADNFKITAEQMLGISVPASSTRLDKVIAAVFPKDSKETDRQRKNREEIVELVRALYPSDKNAGGYGFNGWSIYNTIVEYLDHHRDAKPEARAIASMDPNSWVTKKKDDAQAAVLSLV